MAMAERLEEERHTFQRDTLLELQDKLLELSRWSGLVMSEDVLDCGDGDDPSRPRPRGS